MKRSARIFVAGLLCTVIATGCASTPSKDSEDTQPKEKMGVLGIMGLFVKAVGAGLVDATRATAGDMILQTRDGLSNTSSGQARVGQGRVVCDRTPAQGMAPPPPGMCNDPTSGGMISRESMERNQAQADRVRMKYEQDARQRQQEQEYHQRSLAAQEDERKQREQANTAYWARQEQESRALRAREDAEREKRLAAQEEVRRQQDQDRIAFWAKRGQESSATREREEAERVKRLAAQEEVRREREKIWAELWTKRKQEPRADQTETNTQATAQDRSNTYFQSEQVPHSSSAQTSATRTYAEKQGQKTTNTRTTYAQVLSPQEIAWINSLPPADATRTLPPATIARMKREGKWNTYVANTNSTNRSVAHDLQEKERIEARVTTGLEVAKTTGDVAGVALTFTPAGKSVGAVKKAVVREVDAIGTGGINKLVSQTIDPTTVRFSQDSASSKFKSGDSIGELAAKLKNGTIKPSEIEPIRLVEKDGQLFTLDNRRLQAFREAGVEAPYRMATPQELEAETWKFTTRNNGTTIRIRGNK